jgi:hypothetical protein
MNSKTCFHPFGGTKQPCYLVKYMSACTGKKVVDNMTMRWSGFDSVNDPREYTLKCYIEANGCKETESGSTNNPVPYEPNWHKLKENHLRAQFFSHDFEEDYDKYEKSIKNLLMWAHYGDSQKGVCIVYKTEQLKKYCSDNFKYSLWGPVLYHAAETFRNNNNFLIPQNVQQQENKIDAISKYICESTQCFFFFKKVKDWSYENEYRFLVFLENEVTKDYKDIKIEYDCIESVVLGDKNKDIGWWVANLNGTGIKLKKIKYDTNKNLFRILDINEENQNNKTNYYNRWRMPLKPRNIKDD